MRLIFIFILFNTVTFGQNKKIDSLELVQIKEKLNNILFKEIPKIDQKDTGKILNLLNEAEKITNPKLGNFIVYINNSKAICYDRIGDVKNTLKYSDKAYNTAIEFGDKIGSARALQFKAISYGKRQILDSTEYFLKKSIKIVESNLYNPIVDSTKNKLLLSNLKSNLALNYTLQKKFNKSIDVNFEALLLAKKLKNRKTEMNIYGYIAQNYFDLNNYRKAEEFYLKEKEIAKELNYNIGMAFNNIHIGNIYEEFNKNDFSFKLKNEALNIFKTENHKDGYLLALNSIYTNYRKRKMFSKCYEIENELLNLYDETKKDKSHLYIELGEVYALDNNIIKAEFYFNEAEKILDNTKADKMFFYSKKAILEEQKGNLETALEYKNKELELTQKKLDTTFVNKISYYETKYKTAEKETKIKSQQLELEKEKTNKYIAFAGIGLLLILSAGGFLFYRNKQKQKELQTQNTLLSLQQNINAMELQNLNQQLNPHEIKNLLASISPEIQEKAPDSYRKMLKLFNITKASLNSNSITDTVENQVQQIEDFLSLEKNTLTEPLEYEIENNINNNSLKIPRLMLKNLIENSVKHGIKGKENGGKIKVELQEKDNFIYIAVDDTGKGRQNAISLDSGIGTSTYQKLFATLNQINKENATFEITDKEQGTKVEVKIPTNYKYS